LSTRAQSALLVPFRCWLGCTLWALALPAGAETPSAAASGSLQPPTISWTWSTVKPQPDAPPGYVQFERDCAVCHGSGPAKPGTRALQAKYRGKEPALLAERTDLAPDYIKTVVRHGVSVMPPFRKTELSDSDLDAIVAYLTRKR
jgi:(+)-pinoresinol hydroxylase